MADHDVFISYASKDKSVADAVCAILEKPDRSQRIRCWIAPRDILPGEEWAAAITDAITETKLMVLVFSGAANGSKQILREVDKAVSEGHPVIPFRTEDVPFSKALSHYLRTAHWLDAITPPLEEKIEKLASTIEILLSKEHPRSEADQAATPTATAPGVKSRPERVSGKAVVPATSSAKNADVAWIDDIQDSRLLRVATKLVAVRQACHELLSLMQTKPGNWYVNSVTCSLFNSAIKELRILYGDPFPFETLEGDPIYTEPSPGMVLTFCNSALEYVHRHPLPTSS